VRLSRPRGFTFHAGQFVRLSLDGRDRDYTLVSGPQEPELALCVRRTEGFPARLEWLTAGDELGVEGPLGYFCHRPTERPAVFVATGAGVAPFVAMARAGLRWEWMLQGGREVTELLYPDELRAGARRHLACLSGGGGSAETFAGRVTDFLRDRLPDGRYDLYLCGNQAMIREATRIADRRFRDSHIFTEAYF